MRKAHGLIKTGLLHICHAVARLASALAPAHHVHKIGKGEKREMSKKTGITNKTALFSEHVLDSFRENVGRLPAETGGMLASTGDEHLIDLCCFDTHSQNTAGSFYYDVDSMTEVYRAWKASGCITNGIYHSHPKGVTRPSYHDISSALLHIEFFGLDYLYLPIIQPSPDGLYRLFFYVVHRSPNELEVVLNFVLQAAPQGYKYIPFRAWKKIFPVCELKAYQKSLESLSPAKTGVPLAAKNAAVPGTAPNPSRQAYFSKVSTLYPEKVLNKVIVCVGTGGARSFLENCARSGFRNFILIDADTVSPSNIATQGVFISEMGKKKVEVIRDRIQDINPEAKVICVDRFLDDGMSDEEFKGYLDRFPGKAPTDYLILGCTDSFPAQKRSSLLALKYGIPYLAAMLYAEGAAAELLFVYPGVTESCPRCLLRSRFEKYENGFVNDVDSSSCPIFATERMNALKGYLALMLLMYHESPGSLFNNMLDDVKGRNFVQIRLTPYLKDSKLGIDLFDRTLSDAARYVYFDETLWIPQHPDRPEFGEEPCRLCGGSGDLTELRERWAHTDTRSIRFDHAFPASGEGEAVIGSPAPAQTEAAVAADTVGAA